jgi:hypothetical protein
LKKKKKFKIRNLDPRHVGKILIYFPKIGPVF